MHRTTPLLSLILILSVLTTPAMAQREFEFEVTVDTTQVAQKPELVKWADDAKKLMLEWYPRICNLIQTEGFEPPKQTTLVIRESQEGVAFASRGQIVVSSHWIEKHPEDIGLVVHELVHIVQAYRGRTPSWVTEGIADYLRWAIYEGKPQGWFNRPDEPQGYRQSYRVTAGFFLWLESAKAPGIVAKLNTAARQRAYNDDLFQQATGQTLDELWDEYRGKEPNADNAGGQPAAN